MAAIIFRYPQMQTAASQISNIAERYRQAANTLIQQMDSAIMPWEGESKNRFYQYVMGPANEYISKSVPGAVEALAEMLNENARFMQETDRDVANSLPTTL